VARQLLERQGAARLADLLIQAARVSPEVRRLVDGIRRGAGDSAARTVGGEGAGGEPSDRRMVGDSPAMHEVYKRIRRYATTDLAVLITGESGTGKEMAARAIHDRSGVADGPFVAVNCGALPPTLIAAELFGHEKGAFTGAHARRIGKIEQAAGGTLFLDEIGDLPMEVQGHLLRFLQEGTIERVGGTGTLSVATRVVAATNVDLEKAVEDGRFRKDLFFRLDVLRLDMPPLRARREDIGLMARWFVESFARDLGRPPMAIEPSALAALERHDWPGNVRELISRLRRAMVMCEGDTLTAEALSLDATARPETDGEAETDGGCGLAGIRARTESATLIEALAANDGNVSRTARQLGVSRITVYNMMRRHGISREAG
jgi:DNA-binding NtrC family response regulator